MQGEGKTPQEEAFNLMKEAFEQLKTTVVESREQSLAIIKLEEAMMWLNKHRANHGELEKSETHVE